MDALAIGARVRISGLQARPELNGTVGIVEGPINESWRYPVRHEPSGQVLALRPLSLELVLPPDASATAPAAAIDSPIAAPTTTTSNSGAEVITLWLITADRGVPIYSSAEDGSVKVGWIRRGDVVEAWLAAGVAARLDPSEAARLLSSSGDPEEDEEDEERTIIRYQQQLETRRALWANRQQWDKCFLRTDDPGVVPFGGRTGSPTGDLWFLRSHFASLLDCRPLAPPGSPASATLLHETQPDSAASSAGCWTCEECHPADDDLASGDAPLAPPPLHMLEQRLDAAAIQSLTDRGFVVVDDTLPAELCRVLRAEMDELDARGQMWESQTYGNGDMADGASHPHVVETSLEHRQVRDHAPTFAAMEHDSSLLDRVRGVPGLAALASHHVRIQINQGKGGCYSLHTDAGKRSGAPGQTLCLTALFYLNEEWQQGDGGELRLFPFPHTPEVIAPLMGRMVIFEPRLVHDVLPNWKRRYCFTLWCSKQWTTGEQGPGDVCSARVDHATLNAMEVLPSISEAAAVAEKWRRRAGHPLAYGPAFPPCVRALFLPEMRMCLVRVVHGDDELQQITQSHAQGTERDEVLQGILTHHEMVRASNARWILNLMQQLPAAPRTPAEEQPGGDQAGGTVLRLAELRTLVDVQCPWWM